MVHVVGEENIKLTDCDMDWSNPRRTKQNFKDIH